MTLRTVKDYIEHLKQFPEDWPVRVSTRAGGDIAIEHREIDGMPVVAVFGSNGGRFGENPFTEDEYKKRSQEFLEKMKRGWIYTPDYGDHRLYMDLGHPDSGCYGEHFDARIIERMVAEGILEFFKRPYGRDGVRAIRAALAA